MSEKEKMLAGQLYDPSTPELLNLRAKAHKLCSEYNNTPEENAARRAEIIKELGIKLGNNVYLTGPIYFDYGCFIEMGDNSYANFNLTILDTCPVKIGKNVFIGTGVSIVTPLHPLRYQERNIYMSDKGYYTDDEYGKPITIEDNCWIASNVTICGGVTIGEGSVIGAGSVVTGSIPKNSLAVGNPCKVIRKITEKDALKR
ncbi:MAG: sugar O-acetyltransferase [Bacilli bacterium]|nr:sugar O-acetyltransferase [Bacilli bacterium]